MKKHCCAKLWIIWLAAGCSQLFAQGVYIIQGDKGPVFTDQPQSGAKEVKLRPLSVVPAVIVPPAVSKPADKTPFPGVKDESSAAAYESFSITSPADNGSLAINSGSFEVRLAVNPSLPPPIFSSLLSVTYAASVFFYRFFASFSVS